MELTIVYVLGAIAWITMVLADSLRNDKYAYKVLMIISCAFGVPFIVGGFVVVAIELVRI